MAQVHAPVFAALGDKTRWEILTRLGERPASASALAAELPISRQAIVKQIELLRAVGLVESEQRGREVVHYTLGSRLGALARELDRIANAWDARLVRIKELAEADSVEPGPPG